MVAIATFPEVQETERTRKMRFRILLAAERVFLAQGFSGATTDMIQVAANISKSTLYSYFPNKEILFEAVCGLKSAEFETALRLSPRDAARNIWELLLCDAHALLAQWDQAIEWCRKSIATGSSTEWAYSDLAAAYGWTGRDAEARAAVAELLKLTPG